MAVGKVSGTMPGARRTAGCPDTMLAEGARRQPGWARQAPAHTAPHPSSPLRPQAKRLHSPALPTRGLSPHRQRPALPADRPWPGPSPEVRAGRWAHWRAGSQGQAGKKPQAGGRGTLPSRPSASCSPWLPGPPRPVPRPCPGCSGAGDLAAGVPCGRAPVSPTGSPPGCGHWLLERAWPSERVAPVHSADHEGPRSGR